MKQNQKLDGPTRTIDDIQVVPILFKVKLANISTMFIITVVIPFVFIRMIIILYRIEVFVSVTCSWI